MTLRNLILSTSYAPLLFRRFALNRFNSLRPPRLRVLIYHDILPQQEARFQSQLLWLSRRWRFITPDDFENHLLEQRPLEQDSLLLTFDDGFSSNRRIAQSVLGPLGIRAIFFIVSNFARLNSTAQSKDFIARHIYPGISHECIPSHWSNMTMSDLKSLVADGHTIGAHTANHSRLSTITPAELYSEIVTSANSLEHELGITIKHFAYPFGDISSISKAALLLAQQRFPFIHTGIRGLNNPSTSPRAIRRDAVDLNDSFLVTGSLLEGGVDWAYRKKLVRYHDFLVR